MAVNLNKLILKQTLQWCKRVYNNTCVNVKLLIKNLMLIKLYNSYKFYT